MSSRTAKPAPVVPPTQKRRFKAHPALIYQSLYRQAGSVAKAVAELIMNADDAGAKSISIELKFDRFTAVDEGKGFESLQIIDDFFDTIGAPHALDADGYSTDAKFGTFRIGRGQIFSFASTRWRSNTFQMDVDVKKNGLDYDFSDNLPVKPGCSIEGKFYEPLRDGLLNETLRDLTQFCEYSSMEVRLNGEVISKNPDTEKWDKITDQAFIRLSNRDSAGLKVFNMGILVNEMHSAERFGSGGIIVSKVPLKVNTARNQVQHDCKNWQAITKDFRSMIDTKLERKVEQLTASDRTGVLARLANNLHDFEFFRKAAQMRIFADVNDGVWSAKRMNLNKQFERVGLPPGDFTVTFAERGNIIADKLLQEGKALVLDRGILADLRMKDPTKFPDFMKKLGLFNCVFKPFAELSAHIATRFETVPTNKWTAKETMILSVLDQTQWYVCQLMRASNKSTASEAALRRQLRVGLSESSNGWTDGVSYICIDRRYIDQRRSLSYGDWCDLCTLMIHEMCHNDPSNGSHVHTKEFYELFHDLVRRAGYYVEIAMSSYMSKLKKRYNKVPQQMRQRAMSIWEAHRANEFWEFLNQAGVTTPAKVMKEMAADNVREEELQEMLQSIEEA